MRAVETDSLERCDIFQGLVLHTSLWGKLPGENSQGSHGGLC